MKEQRELKKMIEAARLELDKALETESFEVYYQKSVELDQLIEQYLDAQEFAKVG